MVIAGEGHWNTDMLCMATSVHLLTRLIVTGRAVALKQVTLEALGLLCQRSNKDGGINHYHMLFSFSFFCIGKNLRQQIASCMVQKYDTGLNNMHWTHYIPCVLLFSSFTASSTVRAWGAHRCFHGWPTFTNGKFAACRGHPVHGTMDMDVLLHWYPLVWHSADANTANTLRRKK